MIPNLFLETVSKIDLYKLTALAWSDFGSKFLLATASFKMIMTSSSVFFLNSSKLPQRVLSAGISVLSNHVPFTYLKKSSFGFTEVSINSVRIPNFSVFETTASPDDPSFPGCPSFPIVTEQL